MRNGKIVIELKDGISTVNIEGYQDAVELAFYLARLDRNIQILIKDVEAMNSTLTSLLIHKAKQDMKAGAESSN